MEIRQVGVGVSDADVASPHAHDCNCHTMHAPTMRSRFCQDTGSSRGSARPSLPAPLPGHRRICLRPLAARQTTTEESPSSQFAAARRTLTSAIDSAAKREDYTTAAQLKRELEQINDQDPFYKLNLQLQTSITEQRFQVH